jgi:hypothetical protein
MLSVISLIVIMLSAMLSITMPGGIMLTVISAQFHYAECHSQCCIKC